jgi:hypothetical protein
MNKKTKKAIALAAAVTSLSASLGVAKPADDLETNAIKSGNNGIAGPGDSHTIKWNDPKGDSTQGKLSSQHKTPIILQGGKTSSQDKKVNTIKWADSASSQSKGANAIKWENNK